MILSISREKNVSLQEDGRKRKNMVIKIKFIPAIIFYPF